VRDRVDDDPLSAHLPHDVRDQAVRSRHLLLEDRGGRGDDPNFAGIHQGLKVPAERLGVANHLVGELFEGDDQARFVVQGRASIDDLEPKVRLPRARRPLNEDRIPAVEASHEHLV